MLDCNATGCVVYDTLATLPYILSDDSRLPTSDYGSRPATKDCRNAATVLV